MDNAVVIRAILKTKGDRYIVSIGTGDEQKLWHSVPVPGHSNWSGQHQPSISRSDLMAHHAFS